MKIFITGAGGFIGKEIVRALVEKGHTLRILMLPNESSDHFEKNYKNIVEIIRGDICQKESLSGVMNSCDAVIHLAGAVGYGQKMELCRKINLSGTENIAEEAIRSSIKRFIHFSTVAVYGRVSGVSITEDFPYKKISDPYGDTKIDAELFLLEFAEKNGLNLTVFRPTVVYGPGDDKFLPKLLENIQPNKVKLIGDGKNRVDLIHVKDVSDAVILVLDNKKSFGQIYNLNNTSNCNWRELIEFICKKKKLNPVIVSVKYWIAYLAAALFEFISFFTGKKPRLTRYAVRVTGKPYDYRDDKIQKELGFKPKISLFDGLSELL